MFRPFASCLRPIGATVAQAMLTKGTSEHHILSLMHKLEESTTVHDVEEEQPCQKTFEGASHLNRPRGRSWPTDIGVGRKCVGGWQEPIA